MDFEKNCYFCAMCGNNAHIKLRCLSSPDCGRLVCENPSCPLRSFELEQPSVSISSPIVVCSLDACRTDPGIRNRLANIIKNEIYSSYKFQTMEAAKRELKCVFEKMASKVGPVIDLEPESFKIKLNDDEMSELDRSYQTYLALIGQNDGRLAKYMTLLVATSGFDTKWIDKPPSFFLRSKDFGTRNFNYAKWDEEVARSRDVVKKEFFFLSLSSP